MSDEQQPLDPFEYTKGPRDSSILFLGESWGSEEYAQQKPFVGSSGHELDRMLSESGIDPNSVLFANVFNKQPEGNEAWHFFFTNAEAKTRGLTPTRGLFPNDFAISELKRLAALLAAVEPKVVVASGNYPLWALTDCCSTSSIPTGTGASVNVPGGITSWRGSMIYSAGTVFCTSRPLLRLLPLIHPASIMRNWTQRAVTVHDLRTRIPMALSGMWRPLVAPTIIVPKDESDTRCRDQLLVWLSLLDSGQQLRLAHDIETSRGLIPCMSFAHGGYDETGIAVVIPFIRPEGKGWKSFWSFDQEFELLCLAKRLLEHPNAQIEGQNYLYDTQYLSTICGIIPDLDFDTMLAHHLLFPGTPKGLDYLSSLYCKYHFYWKEDLKEWNNKENFELNLEYNGVDGLRTFESATVLRALINADTKMKELWEWEKKKNVLALQMMNKGVSINRPRRAELAFELSSALELRHSWLRSIIPQSWAATLVKSSKKNWWQSSTQQKLLFSEVLGLKGQINRKTGKATVNFEALQELKRRYPEFERLFDVLIDCRSIAVYHNTFIQAPLDFDNRMRCSFNTAGTKTFRWSSSENAFGRGTNLQNLPVGEED